MELNRPIQHDGWQWLSKRNVLMCRVNATYQKSKRKELLKKETFLCISDQKQNDKFYTDQT